MAKLTGSEIHDQVALGNIEISPFNKDHLGPNSYDLTLGPGLKTYHLGHRDARLNFVSEPLDVKKDNRTEDHEIGEDGYLLKPNILYLAHTNETAGSSHFVPCIEGRSSLARMGIQVHLTAGFGDVGFVGQWTLEILVVHPVIIYANMRVCQIYFDTLEGQIGHLYTGKYSGLEGAVASRSHEDYNG